MKKEFEKPNQILDFLSEIGIDISLQDLKYAIKTGNIFIDDYDFECYYDNYNNVYVLEA